MSWYKVTLTGDIAKSLCFRFVQEVMQCHMTILTDKTVPRPGNQAFLYKFNEPPGESCTYYFSPDAARSYMKLIETYGGEPCDKPSASEVSQCIGGPDATKFLALEDSAAEV
jgi:hypothetical protein